MKTDSFYATDSKDVHRSKVKERRIFLTTSRSIVIHEFTQIISTKAELVLPQRREDCTKCAEFLTRILSGDCAEPKA